MSNTANIYKPTKDYEIITPFGPAIGYKKLSDSFVTKLNSHINDDLLDHSDYLVGKVTQEKRFDKNLSKIFIDEL